MTLALVKPPRTRPTPLREYRCGCGRLLIKADLRTGSAVEAYCERCKRRITFVAA